MRQQLTPPDLAGVGHADLITPRDDSQGVPAFADVSDGCAGQTGLASVPRTLSGRQAIREFLLGNSKLVGENPVSYLARIGLTNPVLDSDVLQGQRACADVVDIFGAESVPATRLSPVVDETVLSAVSKREMVRADTKPDATQMMQQRPFGDRAVLDSPHVSMGSHSVGEAVTTTSSSLPNPAGGFPTTIFFQPVHESSPLSEGLSVYQHSLGGVKHGV